MCVLCMNDRVEFCFGRESSSWITMMMIIIIILMDCIDCINEWMYRFLETNFSFFVFQIAAAMNLIGNEMKKSHLFSPVLCTPMFIYAGTNNTYFTFCLGSWFNSIHPSYSHPIWRFSFWWSTCESMVKTQSVCCSKKKNIWNRLKCYECLVGWLVAIYTLSYKMIFWWIHEIFTKIHTTVIIITKYKKKTWWLNSFWRSMSAINDWHVSSIYIRMMGMYHSASSFFFLSLSCFIFVWLEQRLIQHQRCWWTFVIIIDHRNKKQKQKITILYINVFGFDVGNKSVCVCEERESKHRMECLVDVFGVFHKWQKKGHYYITCQYHNHNGNFNHRWNHQNIYYIQF